MISVDCIVTPAEGEFIPTPLNDLGESHELSDSMIKVFGRYFGLRTIPQSAAAHEHLFSPLLSRLANSSSIKSEDSGILVYAKTQTHNTFFESDWLKNQSYAHGFGHWERMTISMNHCASALSVIHLLNHMSERRPIVLLTGEKSFHKWFSRLSVGVLGEVPVATLLNAGIGDWHVINTAVTHDPSFYENPMAMKNRERAALQERFGDGLQKFLRQSLDASGLKANEVDLIIPYNLNLPLLRHTAKLFGWQDKLYIDNISDVGHAYCSDVLFNLAQVLPVTSAQSILAFAAGLGVTFSSLILVRT